MDKHISQIKKLKDISVSTVRMSGTGKPEQQRSHRMEQRISSASLFSTSAEKNPDIYMFIYFLPFSAL